VLIAGGLAATQSAEAGTIPCYTGNGGANASGGCYGSMSGSWRLDVDCIDTSDIRWPRNVGTRYGAWRYGGGSEAISCASGLRADPRIEIR
jgi:hypothetical protein